ncbi:hypothetical protein KAF81_32845 [Pseudomonas aeruginosa]|uniref:hypothetical protein n=1 Tax=Pseudomonas aeruginosa TaxID=287 RepID=UPI001B3739A5|nr:hypothetical protein [Pseudomonas aeruginosa]MBP8322432.1 hypothetical protein [Pseudomonas aeruginosa]
MKTTLAIVLVCTATLSGCATRSPLSGDAMQSVISRALDKRVIDCVLPYLSTHHLARADVRYHYRDGSVHFQTQDSDLSAHLQECAAPTSGPDGRFEGRIEIWAANAS